MADADDEGRKRGRIEQGGDTLRVVVYAGIDSVTGRRTYKRETVKGADEAAWKKARKVRLIRTAHMWPSISFILRVGEDMHSLDSPIPVRSMY